MKRNFAIRRLFAILMIAGLASAPVSRPIVAASPSHAQTQAMADEMSSSVVTEGMASDMPCCPSNAPAPVDCDKCVFMAGCMSKYFTGMSASVFRPLVIATNAVALLRNALRPDGLGYPPPEHPPRILV